MQTNAETSQQISSSVLNASNRNTLHEIESPNTVEELRRESPRRQLEIPKGSLTIAWELWWFGSPSTNAPPYRSLVPIDLPTIRARKRLSNFRYAMIKIENIARRQETYVDNPSLSQARQMLSAAMSELPIHDLTTPDVANIYSGQPSFTSYENKVDYRG
ncbi:hypothetical protein JG688_00015119 [Phytophthora aleatoria]|uniref:Uncharacterized protein n=1 Tax=Phytophthora aleatoria TaxID=2496075 RepID=A0A8J5LX31_9STRA|nr:hypothetical protein JG688_00015119 [Phytophthora aleatoria]